MNRVLLDRIMAYLSAIPAAFSQAFNPRLGDGDNGNRRSDADQSIAWGWQMYGNW